MKDGLYYLYIKAVIFDNGRLSMDVTDTLKDSESAFLNKITSNLQLLNNNVDGCRIVNLFCILRRIQNLDKVHYNIRYAIDSIREFYENMPDENENKSTNLLHYLSLDSEDLFTNFKRTYFTFILSNKLMPNVVNYTIDDNIDCCCFYGTENLCEDTPEYIDIVFQFWLDREQPILAGKQIMTLPFLSEDLIGRKALSLMSSIETGNFYLVLEGNIKIRLTYENLDYVNRYDTGGFNVNDIQEILYNPVYSYGFTFEPYACYLEWFDVFLYGIASLDIDVNDLDKLEKLYKNFLEFIEQNVCNRLDANGTIIEKGMFLKTLHKCISDTKEFLYAKEEEIVSKNIILRMRSRWVYLDTIYSLIKYVYPEAVENRFNTQPFDIKLWNTLLNKLRPDGNYEKGKAMEDLAYYFLSTISGIKITGRNIRYFTEELDLCFCNISNDPILWKMGPIVLVECKNRKENTSVSTIRNLSQIMEAKGATTIILFTYSKLTRPTIQEINEQLVLGKHFICLDLADLKSLCETRKPDDVLREKLKDELI